MLRNAGRTRHQHHHPWHHHYSLDLSCRRHHWDIPLALSGTTSQERRPAKTKKNAKCILLLNRESERSIAAAEKGIKESTNTSLYRFTIIWFGWKKGSFRNQQDCQGMNGGLDVLACTCGYHGHEWWPYSGWFQCWNTKLFTYLMLSHSHLN